jgi:acyl-CoA synthetase (AMP-forming)/AMP-acid ligase II
MNLTELLTIPAMMFPEREILWFQGQGITYAALADCAARTTGALQGLDVQAGDRVAVMQTSHPTVIEVLFGAAACGAVFVPLNYRARAKELRHMLELSAPRVLIAGERYLDEAQAAAGSTTRVVALDGADASSFSSLVDAAEPVEAVEVEDDRLAVLMFTSGTTANAKAVMLGHDDLVHYVFATTEPAGDETPGTVLIAAPLYHIAGLSAVLTATFGGRRVALQPQFEAGEWLGLIESLGVTHAFLVPTMLRRVIEHPTFDMTDLSRLQVLSYGAAPMPLSVIRRAIDRFPSTVQFLNAFGQTETTSTVTMLDADDHRLDGTPEEVAIKLQRLASIGRPLPDVEIAIVDPNSQPLPAGQVGEVAVRTERVMRGYYGQPDATQETMRDGWLHTRDLGWMDADGYVYLAGRQSDMIIRGGENIAPQEVEVVLGSHPAVDDVAVFGVPDEDWGEVVAAAVVLHSDAQATPELLVEFCHQHLASYKKPTVLHVVDHLPRNALGKLLRRELRAQFAPVEASAS